MHTKICCDCGQELPLDKFFKKSSNTDGYDIRCKKCRKLRYKVDSEERYIRDMYIAQIYRSINRNMNLPNYTLEEFKDWVLVQNNWKQLWKNYSNSEFSDKGLAPSADRINANLPYTLDNINLTTWDMNKKHGHSDVKNNLQHNNQRAVKQYDMDRNYIKTFPSIADALRSLGLSNTKSTWGISSVCDHAIVKSRKTGKEYTVKSYKGFIWEWA